MSNTTKTSGKKNADAIRHRGRKKPPAAQPLPAGGSRLGRGRKTMISSARIQTKPRINESYLQLVLEFPLMSIESDRHLKAASRVIDQLLAKDSLDHGEELYLDALSDLVATYEDKHHPISAPSDSDMLRHLLDMRGISQADLSRNTGLAKSSLSEVLAGKKPFSRQMIRTLAEYFQIDASVLTSNF